MSLYVSVDNTRQTLIETQLLVARKLNEESKPIQNNMLYYFKKQMIKCIKDLESDFMLNEFLSQQKILKSDGIELLHHPSIFGLKTNKEILLFWAENFSLYSKIKKTKSERSLIFTLEYLVHWDIEEVKEVMKRYWKALVDSKFKSKDTYLFEFLKYYCCETIHTEHREFVTKVLEDDYNPTGCLGPGEGQVCFKFCKILFTLASQVRWWVQHVWSVKGCNNRL
ncbi:hypothetical protein DFH28DRAFT_891860 [Melampsora americana]|nr:hypothetical protein DFH28DRAFT_891860 [Melampsora americana]